MKKKETGMVRQIDDLGRIVLPKEFRKTLGIDVKDSIEISMEGPNIILHKYENKCVFCGSVNPKNKFKENRICNSCLKQLKEHIF